VNGIEDIEVVVIEEKYDSKTGKYCCINVVYGNYSKLFKWLKGKSAWAVVEVDNGKEYLTDFALDECVSKVIRYPFSRKVDDLYKACLNTLNEIGKTTILISGTNNEKLRDVLSCGDYNVVLYVWKNESNYSIFKRKSIINI